MKTHITIIMSMSLCAFLSTGCEQDPPAENQVVQPVQEPQAPTLPKVLVENSQRAMIEVISDERLVPDEVVENDKITCEWTPARRTVGVNVHVTDYQTSTFEDHPCLIFTLRSGKTVRCTLTPDKLRGNVLHWEMIKDK